MSTLCARRPCTPPPSPVSRVFACSSFQRAGISTRPSIMRSGVSPSGRSSCRGELRALEPTPVGGAFWKADEAEASPHGPAPSAQSRIRQQVSSLRRRKSLFAVLGVLEALGLDVQTGKSATALGILGKGTGRPVEMIVKQHPRREQTVLLSKGQAVHLDRTMTFAPAPLYDHTVPSAST